VGWSVRGAGGSVRGVGGSLRGADSGFNGRDVPRDVPRDFRAGLSQLYRIFELTDRIWGYFTTTVGRDSSRDHRGRAFRPH
jgi:hypothetical protein